MTHPVATAVEPLKADAMQSARARAEEQIARVLVALAEVNWDAEKVAPYPRSSTMSRNDYLAAKRKYYLFRQLTGNANPHGSRHMHDPDLVKRDPAREARFIQEAQELAATQYELFVAKLINKIGECTAAALQGNHVWSHSILLITKADGSTERWKTQQIWNVSKLGLHYPQWPSRKVK